MSLLSARTLVFGSSAVILVLEILAGRLMAPYVGVSLETFTGIIGVFLAGIALGAWGGGVLADRTDPARLLGPLLLASGVATLLGPPIVDALGAAVRTGGPVEIVALTAAGFLVPTVALAAVTPLVIKLRLRSLAETGSVVGSFSAVGTLGSLVGTFATGFVLLAAFPSRPLVAAVGVALGLVGVVALVHRGRLAAAGLGVAFAVAAAATLAVAGGPCDVETTYYCASVEIDPTRPGGRVLWLDALRHSYVDLDDPTHLEFRYTQVMADVVAAIPPGPLDVAYIGGGGFTLPRHTGAVRPGSTATVLEIDGDLVTLAEDRLGLVARHDLTVVVGDARLALPTLPPGGFGAVVGDAFGGLSVPWHLTTVEFLEQVAGLLDVGGVYVVNVIDHPPLDFARAATATLAAVFSDVAVIAPPDVVAGTVGGNVVLVAVVHGEVDRAGITAAIGERGGVEVVTDPAATYRFIGGARVLVDDFAPVDQLLSPRPRRVAP